MDRPATPLALIGYGRIGRGVVQAWQRGELPGWDLVGVLVRTLPPDAPAGCTTDRAELLGRRPALVVDLAGPQALAQHAEAVLAQAELWTVGAAALADAALLARIERVGAASGHRLRVLPGAIAGLDGVAATAVDPQASLELDIELRPSAQPGAGLLFEGSVREAARRFPDSVNVAAAAALAGPGLDASRIRVSAPGPAASNRLALTARSRHGALRAEVQVPATPLAHPVVDAVLAALRRQRQVVWVG